MSMLVVCSHGTRSRAGATRVRGLVAAVEDALPAIEVREANVDVHPPFLDDVITPGAVVVPLCWRLGTTRRSTSPGRRPGRCARHARTGT